MITVTFVNAVGDGASRSIHSGTTLEDFLRQEVPNYNPGSLAIRVKRGGTTYGRDGNEIGEGFSLQNGDRIVLLPKKPDMA